MDSARHTNGDRCDLSDLADIFVSLHDALDARDREFGLDFDPRAGTRLWDFVRHGGHCARGLGNGRIILQARGAASHFVLERRNVLFGDAWGLSCGIEERRGVVGSAVSERAQRRVGRRVGGDRKRGKVGRSWTIVLGHAVTVDAKGEKTGARRLGGFVPF